MFSIKRRKITTTFSVLISFLVILSFFSSAVFAASLSDVQVTAPAHGHEGHSTDTNEGDSIETNQEQSAQKNSTPEEHSSSSSHGHGEDKTDQQNQTSDPNWLVIGGFLGVISAIILTAGILKYKASKEGLENVSE